MVSWRHWLAGFSRAWRWADVRPLLGYSMLRWVRFGKSGRQALSDGGDTVSSVVAGKVMVRWRQCFAGFSRARRWVEASPLLGYSMLSFIRFGKSGRSA